jgi:hypothetical protein
VLKGFIKGDVWAKKSARSLYNVKRERTFDPSTARIRMLASRTKV